MSPGWLRSAFTCSWVLQHVKHMFTMVWCQRILDICVYFACTFLVAVQRAKISLSSGLQSQSANFDKWKLPFWASFPYSIAGYYCRLSMALHGPTIYQCYGPLAAFAVFLWLQVIATTWSPQSTSPSLIFSPSHASRPPPSCLYCWR